MGRLIEDLSTDELEQLLEDYDEGIVRISDLIDKYGLEYTPSRLSTFLPEIVCDEECEYCGKGSRMVIPRSRTTARKKCNICGHQISLKRNIIRCNCDNCCKKSQDRIEQHIKNVHDYLENIERPNTSFESLEFLERAFLLETFEKSGDRQLKCLIGSKLATEDYNLLKDRNLISLDVSSPVEAFKENLSYYIHSVNYYINVKDFSVYYDQYYNDVNVFTDLTAKEKYTALKMLIKYDLLIKFRQLMNERGLDVNFTETGSVALNVLIEKISYSQILNIMYKVAVFYLDKTKTGKIYKKNAANGALASVTTFYNNAIHRGGALNHSKVEYASRILRYFIVIVLEKPITSLESVILESDIE